MVDKVKMDLKCSDNQLKVKMPNILLNLITVLYHFKGTVRPKSKIHIFLLTCRQIEQI